MNRCFDLALVPEEFRTDALVEYGVANLELHTYLDSKPSESDPLLQSLKEDAQLAEHNLSDDEHDVVVAADRMRNPEHDYHRAWSFHEHLREQRQYRFALWATDWLRRRDGSAVVRIKEAEQLKLDECARQGLDALCELFSLNEFLCAVRRVPHVFYESDDPKEGVVEFRTVPAYEAWLTAKTIHMSKKR